MTNKELARIKIKEECEKLFFYENKNLVLEWATGVGKTFNSLNLCNKSGFNRILIFVAETQHIQMWKDDMNLNGFGNLINKIHFSCYHSIKKYQNVECDLIILDEGHHAFSDKRINYLKSIKAKRAILLSATIDDSEYELFCNIFNNVKRYSINFKTAIKAGLLNIPTFNIYTFKLNESSKSEIIEFKRGNGLIKIKCNYDERLNYIYNKNKYPNIHLTISCTQKEKYDYIESNYSYLLSKFRSDGNKNMSKLLFAGSRRKAYLSSIKTGRLKYLCNKLKHKRFICFCGNIEQADMVSNNTAIHSKSKKTPTEIVNKFNSGEISEIFAVGMLVEGTNLTNIESAIICQLDGESLKFIQKTGRGMRAEFPEINILLCLNTKDEEYYLDSFKDIPLEYIKIKEL